MFILNNQEILMIKVATTKANIETERIQHQNAKFCKYNGIELLVIDEDFPEIKVETFFDYLSKEERKLYLQWLYLSKGSFLLNITYCWLETLGFFYLIIVRLFIFMKTADFASAFFVTT